MQVIGAGYAMATSAFLQFAITTVLSSRLPQLNGAISMPSRESFQHWSEYFAIAVPVMIMISGELVAFEVFNLASGYFGVTEQATQVILVNICVFAFQVPKGF